MDEMKDKCKNYDKTKQRCRECTDYKPYWNDCYEPTEE